MNFKSEIVIGLEIHTTLKTKSKMFCSCAMEAKKPNSSVCEVCLGHPGSKPVLNKKAVEYAVKLALATKSTIAKELIFSRKSYFYPDMAKNYQISQYEIPFAEKGKIMLKSGKEISLTRIHMEEDPASLVHPGSMQESAYVMVDYNRSGSPLLEVVTEPQLESPEEARDFMKQLITILGYLGIFDVNNGIIKADANVSVKESGYRRVELKNITGFKEIERALRYEVERQKQEVKDGKTIARETRAWDSSRGISFSLRTKETEEDYGYIIDPDLVKVTLSKEWIKLIEKEMPELAADKVSKFLSRHKIKKEDAEIIAQERELAELFERVAEEVDPILAAKWLRRELTRVLNYNKKTLKEIELDEKNIIMLLKLIEEKKITEKTGQRLIEKLIEKPFDVAEYVKKEKLAVVSDKSQLEKFCKEAIKENPKAVEDYKKGEEKSFHFIVGQVMAKSKGKASPKEVNEILRKLLKK